MTLINCLTADIPRAQAIYVLPQPVAPSRITLCFSCIYSQVARRSIVLGSRFLSLWYRCSLWLCQYYTRNKKLYKLKRILKRNFVYYKGDYYPLTTSDLVWRMIPINELESEWDFGVDVPNDEVNNIVLELIREKRESL